MVFICPQLDLKNGMLLISCHNSPHLGVLRIPLDSNPSSMAALKCSSSRVCGDAVNILRYDTPEIMNFFTAAIGVNCTLARFPASLTNRNFKSDSRNQAQQNGPNILLSNESPILIINRASVDRVNDGIELRGGKKVSPDVFRANIVIGSAADGTDMPYAEDNWSHIQIGAEVFEVCFSHHEFLFK